MTKTDTVIAQVFDLAQLPQINPQYNIAPTQMVAAVLNSSERDSRHMQLLTWGLIPAWAKDPRIGAKLINARSETAAEKPSFRNALKHRRCLVVADGFYEWQKQEGKKQPFYFRLQTNKPFGMAGLWEEWTSPTGEIIHSCTILTTTANELMLPIHERMPVIIEPKDYNLWLDLKVQTPASVQSLLQPYPAEEMTAYAVSTLVNKPTNNTPECINSL